MGGGEERGGCHRGWAGDGGGGAPGGDLLICRADLRRRVFCAGGMNDPDRIEETASEEQASSSLTLDQAPRSSRLHGQVESGGTVAKHEACTPTQITTHAGGGAATRAVQNAPDTPRGPPPRSTPGAHRAGKERARSDEGRFPTLRVDMMPGLQCTVNKRRTHSDPPRKPPQALGVLFFLRHVSKLDQRTSATRSQAY